MWDDGAKTHKAYKASAVVSSELHCERPSLTIRSLAVGLLVGDSVADNGVSPTGCVPVSPCNVDLHTTGAIRIRLLFVLIICTWERSGESWLL